MRILNVSKFVIVTWLSLWLFTVTAMCQQIPPAARAAWATVRIPSHGCSGVIIYTRDSKTLILTCAHAFRGSAGSKALVINAPAFQGRTSTGTRPRLVGVDWVRDLALVQIDYGPVRYVANIAQRRPAYRRSVCVVGYSRMKLPAESRCGRVLGVEVMRHGGHNFSALITSHYPIGGQSGGPLIDAGTGEVVGITHGWQQRPGRRREGVFVAGEEIREFLGYNDYQVNRLPGRRPGPIGRPPQIAERREFPGPAIGEDCPT